MEQQQHTTQQENGVGFDLKFELLRYARYWYWFLLGIVLMLSGAYIYLRYTPNTYSASASFKILDNSTNTFKMPSMGGVSLFARPRVNLENEMRIVKSHRLMSQVVHNLGMTEQFHALGYINEVECWGFKPFEVVWEMKEIENLLISFEIELQKDGFIFISEPYSLMHKGMHSYNKVINTDGGSFRISLNERSHEYMGRKMRYSKRTNFDATSSLIGSINVAVVGKESEILEVTTAGVHTGRITDVLNELVRVFNQDGINDRQEVSKRTIDFVNDRFVSLERELDSIEFGKEGYKRKNLISFIEGDASMAGTRKERTLSDLNVAETQVLLSQITLDALRKSGEEDLLPGDLGLANAQVNTLIGDYNKGLQELKQLRVTTGDNHPMTVKAKESLQSLRQNIAATLRSYEAQLKVNIKQLERIQSESIGMYSSIPEKEKTLRAIERQQQIKESLYMILLQKREEAAINLAITEPSIKVVDFAIAGKAPIAPKRNVIWLGSFMLGLLLPFGALYLFFMSDTKMHTRKDVQAMSPAITIAAEIPHLDKEVMLMSIHDRSVLGEAFRILRTNLSYLLPDKQDGNAHVVFVTSTIKGEGKTFTSTNLAIALTALNKKVLVVGADVRNPQLHRLLNAEKTQKGLTNYLYGKVTDWRNVVNTGVLQNPLLHVVFSGPIPPNPAELLSNGRFEQLIAEAKTEYDYIIVDTAPTILVTDTLLISSLADLTLYLCRANYTEKQLLEFSKELNAQNKLNNMAYVINDIGAGKAYGYGYGYGYGYRYNYSYNYGYGYGYTEDQEENQMPKKGFWNKLRS